MKAFTIALFVFVFGAFAMAQDTFSIVAVDSLTGEVGSAGASCISADNLEAFFPNDDPDFLGDLLPGIGAINTQSYYLAANQDNANSQLAAGKTPQEVVDWLASNDAEFSSEQRQYGVAALINGQPMAAGFTGPGCFDFKNHVTGPNYAIQGNILLGQQILDSMQARFLAAEASGLCLSERLMAALQGAKVPGADTRCLSNGTSAMFAFLKVAKPGDDAANPSVRLFVSYNPVGIEPIDELQKVFDEAVPCLANGALEKKIEPSFKVSPNPTTGAFTIQSPWPTPGHRLDVFDAAGRPVLSHWFDNPADEKMAINAPGLYFLRLTSANGASKWEKLVVQR